MGIDRTARLDPRRTRHPRAVIAGACEQSRAVVPCTPVFGHWPILAGGPRSGGRPPPPHLIPVLEIPCTNCRWNARNTARIGSTVTVATAITAPHGEANAGLLVRVDSATGTVKLSLPCSTTIGHRKSLQRAMKARITSTPMSGPQVGSTTWKKARNSPAPSTRAASTKASGTESMNCRAMKMPTTSKAVGRMTAQGESTSPRRATTRNAGTKVTWMGIMMVMRNAVYSTPLPIKRYFASAYPAPSETHTEIAVVMTAMNNEFPIQRHTGWVENTSLKFMNVGSDGHR